MRRLRIKAARKSGGVRAARRGLAWSGDMYRSAVAARAAPVLPAGRVIAAACRQAPQRALRQQRGQELPQHGSGIACLWRHIADPAAPTAGRATQLLRMLDQHPPEGCGSAVAGWLSTVLQPQQPTFQIPNNSDVHHKVDLQRGAASGQGESTIGPAQ